MQLSNDNADTLFKELLQDLPSEIEEMAREFEAFTRSRKIKTPIQLFRAVMLYCGLDKSLRETGANLALLDEKLSDTAVAKRLAACQPWLKAVLRKMLESEEIPSLPKQMRILVGDGTTVQGPGATGTENMIHVMMDLISLEFTHIEITDDKTGESLRNFSLGSGDIAMLDRGYCHAGSIVRSVREGSHVIIRFKPHKVPFTDPDGNCIDLVKVLKDQFHQTTKTVHIMLGKGEEQVMGYLHCYRLTEEQANRARQKIRKESSKKGTTPKEETLCLGGWVLVFTTVDPSFISAEQICQLYRLRWQVELAIKRWKSLLDLSQLRAKKGSSLAPLWLYGKLLYALILEKRMRRTFSDQWGRLNQDRQATWWRFWKMIKDEITPMITGSPFWKKEKIEECFAVLIERPRKRKLQRISPEVLEGLTMLNELLQKNWRKAA